MSICQLLNKHIHTRTLSRLNKKKQLRVARISSSMKQDKQQQLKKTLFKQVMELRKKIIIRLKSLPS